MYRFISGGPYEYEREPVHTVWEPCYRKHEAAFALTWQTVFKIRMSFLENVNTDYPDWSEGICFIHVAFINVDNIAGHLIALVHDELVYLKEIFVGYTFALNATKNILTVFLEERERT